ncbi:peptide MFS transporter [Thermophagus xiamenensis]|jgi:POT family proton-dependent oligopeptide transporter|uniref:Proton-dependent oligopeptide transporter, POT family n=1 Tax=Thermophagus xiamenensis TaxID=385682 RepID=A0A1I1W616_9BACT|nr:peptide MFS transporter [Thermophagus xiamenensis]SFD88430.1 proton-dependent oligopeptide transporter, POT family [Thermophagus xiamenensis]
MDTSSKRHPQGLWVLFFTEMWERFSYYGMRALLVLYLTSSIVNGGFAYAENHALEIYGIFTGLVYLTPILGGIIADRFIGQRKSVFIGGIVMALGQAALAYSEYIAVPEGGEAIQTLREFWLFIGLGLLILGNGFFKPNISTMVGRLYADGDPRKDSAFTIFYMGINLGAFLAPFIAGYLGESVGWAWGFGSVSVGMVLGVIWFWIEQSKLGTIGFGPKRKFTGEVERLNARDWGEVWIWVLAIVGFIYLFVKTWWIMPEVVTDWIIRVVALGAISVIAYMIIKNTTGKTEWSRIGAILVFCFFNIFFWSGFEQAGGTFNLFARDMTDRMIGSFEINASWFQSVNAALIVGLAPVFSMLWIWLGKYNPNTPVKFGLGLTLLSLGFVVMYTADMKASPENLVSPLWLVSVYLLHTMGELCLSPIGLSMISKLSPPKITSLMMGLWFGSTALANYLAGALKSILETYMPGMNLFLFLVITSGSAALLMYLISPWLKKLMRGVD